MSNVKPLIEKLYSGEITKEDFIRSYFKDKVISNNAVAELLIKGILFQDDTLVTEAVVLLYTGEFPLSEFSAKLCHLLLMHWHTKHEDIIGLLRKIADPSMIDCIYNAAELQFEYLSYDETYGFARKCIKAIAAIGNEHATDRLNQLSNSKIDKISEYAKKELNNLNQF